MAAAGAGRVRCGISAAYREGNAMRMLIGCVLIVVLSGCIPIGFAGRTSAIGAPGHAAATAWPAAEARGVSV